MTFDKAAMIRDSCLISSALLLNVS
jgi:hypothetical protein